MGKGTSPRCDHCGKRIRPNHHELRLSYPTSGQGIGRYHTRPDCQAAAAKYLTGGTVLLATYYHPPRCGDDQAHCDAGLSEVVA